MIVQIADVAVRISTARPEHAAAVQHLLSGALGHEGPAEIVIEWRDEQIAVPDRPSEHGAPALGAWHEADSVLLAHGVLTARVANDRIEIGGGAEPSDDASSPLWLDFRRMFEFGITYLLAEHDRYMLHGASIARDGQALVIFGETGQGKSTAAWAAYQAGWELLGDDYFFARPTADGYEVTGLRKPVAIPGELIDEPPSGARPFERAGKSVV